MFPFSFSHNNFTSLLILMQQQQTAFENNVRKEEIDHTRQFLRFPNCFLINQIIVLHLSIFLMSYFYLLLNWRSPNLVERQRVNCSSSDRNLAFSNFKALKTAILNLAQIMKIVFEFIESIVGEVTVLIVWCLMPFKQYFSYIAVASAPIHALLEFFKSNLHNILSKPLAAFPHHHCQNKGQ